MTLGSVVLGLVNGMLIGLLAIGVVLIYKANRFLNMAHAQLGALSAELLGKLVLDEGLSWWVALAVCVPVGAALGVGVDRVIVRPLRARSASSVTLLIATVGLAQLLLAVALVPWLGPSTAALQLHGYPLPFHAHVEVGGVVLNGADLLIVIAVPLIVAGLAAFLKLSRLGRMVRAAASNPDAARLAGISTDRMSALIWGIAAAVSAVAAVLQSPSQSTFSGSELGPQLLLLGLGAAAFGAFSSLPGALLGGLVIGLAQQLTLAESSDAGTAQLVVFLLILLVVLVRGRSIGRVFQTTGAVVKDRPPLRVPEILRESFVIRNQRRALVAAGLAVGLLAPLVPIWTSESKRFQLSLVLVYALVALSVTVAVGWAGQVSLGQFALVGAAAFAAAHLLQRGWSLPMVAIVGAGIGGLIMVVVGLPAVRVPGLTLGVTTLGLAVVSPAWLFRQGWLGTPRSQGLDLDAPGLMRGFGHPSSMLTVYYFGLALVVMASAAIWAMRRSLPGRLIVAVRDNDAKAAAFGVTPATVKLAALALSGVLAGLAGVLWADAWRTVSVLQFPATASFSVLAAPIIGGLGSVAGALIGAAVLYGPVFFLSPYIHSWFGSSGQIGFELLFGGLGLILVVRRFPAGIVGALHDAWQRHLDRLAERAPVPAGEPDGPVLLARDVSITFGGIRALTGASIAVPPGTIVGLIGPNGAGKSTLMNVISGVLTPDEGEVRILGTDARGYAPEMRFALGLARTFQSATLFPGLTVLETMQVAMANQHRIGMVAAATGAPWARAIEARSRDAADLVVDRFGLRPWADALTGDLSTGTRRICDLAAQVACAPKVLLLDEPTAGVAQREAEAFAGLLRGIRAELGCSILIIEHDMPLLMAVCDHVYAMESGQIIAEGTPEQVRNNPRVVASYLGTDAAAIDRSNGRAPARTARGSKTAAKPKPTPREPVAATSERKRARTGPSAGR